MSTRLTLPFALSLAALSAPPLAAQGEVRPPDVPAPPPAAVASADTLAAAREAVAFTDAINAIAGSGKPVDEKIAAINALRPRAAALGKLVDRVGQPQLRRAIHGMLTEAERQQRLATSLAVIDNNPELYDVFMDISALLVGRIATETPPEEVAAAFLATLREGARLMQDTALTGQERLDRLENQARCMSRFYPWVVRGGDSDAVADILATGGELDALIAQHGRLPLWETSEDAALADAAKTYASTLSEILYLFYPRHQEAPATDSPPPSPN